MASCRMIGKAAQPLCSLFDWGQHSSEPAKQLKAWVFLMQATNRINLPDRGIKGSPQSMSCT